MRRTTRALTALAPAALAAVLLAVSSSAGAGALGRHHRHHNARHAHATHRKHGVRSAHKTVSHKTVTHKTVTHKTKHAHAAKPGAKASTPGASSAGTGGAGVSTSRGEGNPPPAAPAAAPTFSPATYVDYKRLGGEPTIVVDRWPFPDGTTRDVMYASSPMGFVYPHYSTFFRSDDLGQTFHVPTHVPVFGATEPNAGGGGDSSIAIGTVTHKVFFADLPGPACDTLNVSSDLGEHWTSDPLGCGSGPGAIDDRQWVAADETYPGSQNVYMSFMNDTNLTAGTLSLARSTHDGAPGSFVTDSTCNTLSLNGAQIDNLPTAPAPDSTPTACPDPADPQIQIAGPVVADQSGTSPFAHRVYIPFLRADSSGNNGTVWSMYMAVSASGGRSWTRHLVAKLGVHEADNLFPVAAVDRGGNVYAVWTQAAGNTADTKTLGGETDTYLSVSRDGGATWSAPVAVSPQGTSSVMPWVVAGDAGRVDVVFYRSSTALNPNADFVDASGNECSQGTAGCNANPSLWNVYLAQSLDALAPHPDFTLVKVSEHPNHLGQICTSGLNCTTGGNRNLLDFFSVDVTHTGAAAVIWADDYNQKTLDRDKFALQLGGSTLFADGSASSLAASWPTHANGVSDRSGDVVDAQGAPLGDASGMDILGADVSRSGGNLTVTLTLSGPPTAANATAASRGLATGGLWGLEFWSPTNDLYVGYRDNPLDGAPAVEAGTVDNSNPTATSTEFDPIQVGTLGGTCLAAGAAAGAVGAVAGATGTATGAVNGAVASTTGTASGTVASTTGTVQGVAGSTTSTVGGTTGSLTTVTPLRLLQAASDTPGCTLVLTTPLAGLGLSASAPLQSAFGFSVYLDGASGPVTSNSELADATAPFDTTG